MANTDIWRRRLALDRARRDEIKRVMEEYDKGYYAALRELYDECADSEKGHNWQFSHTGPVGTPWFYCASCGLTKSGELP